MNKLTLTAIALVAVVSTAASAREVDSQGQRIFNDWSYTTDDRTTSATDDVFGAKPVDQQVLHDQRRQQWENATPEQKKQMKAKHHAKAAAAKSSAKPAAKPATDANGKPVHHHHHKKAAAATPAKSSMAPAETPPGNQ